MKTNMTATLTFNLDDEQDAMAHFRCVKALDMALALWTLLARLRALEEVSESDMVNGEAMLNICQEVMEEHGIVMDELIC